MIVAFCLCFHVPAYAQATPSDASRSDALKAGAMQDADPVSFWDGFLADGGIMPLVDGLYGEDWNYLSVWVPKAGGTEVYKTVPYADGRYLWRNPDPDVYVPANFFVIDLHKPTLPAAGKYRLQWRMDSANAYPTINKLDIQYRIVKPNTVVNHQRVRGVGFKTHNTYWEGNFNIDIPANCETVAFVFYINQPSGNVTPYDMGGFTYKFYQVQDSSLGDPVAPPSDPSSTPEQDISNTVDIISGVVDSISGAVSDISGGIGSLVSLQEQTNSLILQVVQTISNQLEAFWNQLAGEFTNLYNKLTDQHNELMDADRTNVEDHMENDDKNTDRIIDELGREHDEDRNGYDDQGWKDQKDKIDGVIADYERAEDELLGDAKGNLDNFAFDNPFTQFNVVMADISSILTGIYEALGSFNIPIGFSLTLTVAMLCIGWYRFKGGL